MITHTIDSQVKRQTQIYKFKKFAKTLNFLIKKNKKHYTRHTSKSCLIRCVHMKWIRRVLWKIHSGHDSVHRQTEDGQTDKVKPVYPLQLHIRFTSLTKYNLQECFRLSNWFCLWCLVVSMNKLTFVWGSIIVLNDSWSVSLVGWRNVYFCCIHTFLYLTNQLFAIGNRYTSMYKINFLCCLTNDERLQWPWEHDIYPVHCFCPSSAKYIFMSDWPQVIGLL